ncbi:MAG: MarR family winged helix-turn-helix transcriptional regulator [Actinomycetota bacterium]|nr:MarR family winged helix-turn-helix transcriptional regulator [Actinomycetota bacterium]
MNTAEQGAYVPTDTSAPRATSTAAEPASADIQSPLLAVEQAMIRLRRSMSRRSLGSRTAAEVLAQYGVQLSLSQMAVVDAVEEGRVTPGQEVTVGLVAERLALDPSRASRHVASAIRSRLVQRVASQSDGRRVHLELTPQGQQIATTMHAVRQTSFAEIMAGWSDHDRREFARLLARFTE